MKKQDVIEKFRCNLEYQNVEAVKQYFNIKQINYVMAIVSSVLVAMILLGAIIQFIRRIFEILILYLVSPLFVSTMPIDDGAKFRDWKNLFLVKMLSSFGPVVMLNLYFIVVPMVTTAEVDFGFTSANAWMDGMVKLFFVIGGAYAIYKSQHLLISILDPAAAGAAAESGFLAASLMGGVMGKVGKMAAGSGQKSISADQYQTKSQAFTGK